MYITVANPPGLGYHHTGCAAGDAVDQRHQPARPWR